MTLLAWLLNIVALCLVAGLLIGATWLWDRMNNRSDAMGESTKELAP